MKRKIFTLVVALLALAGFNANALVVGIQAGDSLPQADMTNERGGYGGWLTNMNYKLTYDGTAWKYVKGAPNLKKGSSDRITINNPSANFVTFTSIDGTPLKLQDPGGVWQTQFVVFRSASANASGTGGIPASTYYTTGAGRLARDPARVITPKSWGGGDFWGFVGVNANGYVDDDDLLIVVHNKAGALSLITYKTYVASLNSGITKGGNQYFPLYIWTEQLSGRWATPNDFKDCRFTQFLFNGAVQNFGTATDVFTVKQVDYVQNGDVTNTNNIITHIPGGATFEGLTGKADPYYGTTSASFTPAQVIPLFVLADPNTCNVLSVSRNNDNVTQIQQDGGYSNKLELRAYGSYYDWQAQKIQAMAPANANYDTYTSLQKFAIWINTDGEFVLYPAASYYWKYGEPKMDKTWGQADNILPNAVLKYNNINVSWAAGSNQPIDKSYGVQIGWWNGDETGTWNGNVLTPGNPVPYVCTAPNMIQTSSKYQERVLTLGCKEETGDLSDWFYFLQVNMASSDTTGLWALDRTVNPGAALNANAGTTGYQWQHGLNYVLSTQMWSDNTKSLAAVPKEMVRNEATADAEYWRFPYDSVNMAAHWKVIAAKDPVTDAILGYRIINMLGDTLKFASGKNALAGGYIPINGLMPGAPPSTGFAGVKYFGRPEDTGLAWNNVTHWFNLNTIDYTSAPCDLWTIHKMKGQQTFYIEPVCGGSLKYGAVGGNIGGWYNAKYNAPYPSLTYYNAMKNAGNGYSYYQRDVLLEAALAPGLLVSYVDNNFSACGGIPITMKPIDYVPQYGIPNQQLYPGEPVNTVNNTNDKDFQYRDSLTAYTFLEGNYDLREATAVDNGLRLNYATVDIHNGLGTTIDVARLDSAKGSNVLQFIPVSGPLGQQRTAEIRKFKGMVNNIGTDTLYGETYKWYLVKNNATGRYMTFDTLNVTAATNREKVGFVFTADLTNATPVRLYQPLVGDKKFGNFLFQFYMPENVYIYGVDKKTPVGVWVNSFPNTEAALGAAPVPGGGEVCFATLTAQSNYIYGARAYTGTVAGTRFTVVGKENTLICTPEFIDPTWMGANRLLSLPLKNQVWVKESANQSWIATGASNRGIMSRDVANQTTLTHTYVTSIKVYASGTGVNALYKESGIAKVGIPHNVYTSPAAKGDTTWVGSRLTATLSSTHDQNNTGTDGVQWGFNTDVEVPLYYVQNDAGLYLTVVPNTDMFSDGTTPSDVSGIRLEWQPRFVWDATTKDIYTKYGFDRQALQLFAISGCKDLKDGWYGKFIYLPLASYKVDDYKNGAIVQTASSNATQINDVFYNWNLGKGSYGANDVQGCWRISQVNATQLTTNDLVVMTANAGYTAGLTPLEFKLSKMDYLQPKCDYWLVKSTSTTGAHKNQFITLDNWVSAANDYTMTAHWAIDYSTDPVNDPKLAVFKPELQSMYGVPTVPTNLRGQYYFVKQIAAGTKADTTQYQIIDVSGYATGNFAAKFDTISLACTKHALPFYDLEADGKYDLNAVKLAILEATTFHDRNITDSISTDKSTPVPVYRGGKLIGYKTLINQLEPTANFKDAKYLTVYKENVRDLTEDRPATASTKHVIPYYSFSITKADGKEYFLNVDKAGANVNRQDSVYWTYLDDTSKGQLFDWQNNKYYLPTYKFCLPYKWVNGKLADKIMYGSPAQPYPPVYLQTLDIAVDNYPDLLIVGANSTIVTSRNLYDVVLPANRANDLKWNIYTVNYNNIDLDKVTAWIFGGPIPNGDQWVPIAGIVDKTPNTSAAKKDGQLTDTKVANGGTLFLAESGNTPNVGTFTGVNDAPVLTVTFEGDTTIGSYAVRKIWYYRVSLLSKADGKVLYLTDATGNTANVPQLLYNGQYYTRGWFTSLMANEPAYVANQIFADTKFVQTFGFKYVTDSSDPKQLFYVVSNANYTDPKNEAAYRYLSTVNNNLVFKGGVSDATVFQWGKAANGSYTVIEAVGQGNIFGVEGGVRVLNETGKVDIYTIDGRLIKSAVLNGTDQTIAAPRGIAIVKAGSKVVKVVVQ